MTISSITLDLRIVFKKFYCPVCGARLKLIKKDKFLLDDEKKRYYKKHFPWGVPINMDISKVYQMFICSECGYYSTTDNQLIIHKKQRLLKKKIICNSD